VLKDASGNQWGTMYGTPPENTFVYNVTRAEVNAITLTPVPASGSGSAVQGGILSGSTVTLSSNYSASGLTTVVSLSKDGEAVDFDTVFSSYALSTQVGDGAVQGPYEMNGAYSAFTYGPSGGYGVTAGVDQVTTVNGAVKDTAPMGTYTIKTEVKVLSTGAVLATGTYTLTVTAAPDTTAPALQSVTPSEGDVELAYGANFILTVDASDENLYELEIDHSLEGTVPEFSVYAAEGDGAYGTAGDKADFEAAGASVSYDEDEQKWEINMGPAVTDAILLNHGITFYIVLKDASGNQWGTMYGTTPENTFAYNVTMAEEL
jgi:hypothetical protein